MFEVRTVRIPDVPVDMVLANEAHLDDVERELRLMSFSAIAESEEGVRRLVALGPVLTEYAGTRRRLRTLAGAAHERGEKRFVIELRLPPDAGADMEQVVVLLEQLDEVCRRPNPPLLALPASPELAAFRRWFVREVSRHLL